MELREIRSAGGWDFHLDLHPRATIVTGLDQTLRAQLAAQVQAAIKNDLPGLQLIAQTDQGPQPVTAARLAAANVPSMTDLLLRPRDLPGALVRASHRLGESEEAESEPDEVVQARHGLELARQAEAVSSSALQQLQGETSASSIGVLDLDLARRRVSDAAGRVTQATEAVAESGGPAAVALREASVAALRDDQLRLQTLLATSTDPPDTTPVANALAALHHESEVGGPVSAAALDLADRWADLQRRWAATPHSKASPRQLEDARARLEVARIELARAEQYAKPLYVDRADREQLDEIHEEVVSLQERAERKMAGRLIKRRLEAAQAVELGILQRIGVSSYDAYLFRTSPGLGDMDAADRLVQARQRMAEAEARWEIVHEDEPEELRTLRRERSLIMSAAAELLGAAVPEEELEIALRNHREPPDLSRRLDELNDALKAVGVSVRASLPEEAESWLAERQSEAKAVEDASRRLKELDEELPVALAALDAARARGDARSDDLSSELQRAQEELEAAERALAEAERAVAESSRHAEQIADARRTLARSQRRRAEAESDLAHALAKSAEASDRPGLPEVVIDEVDVTGVNLEEAEVYVLARISGLRDVGEVGGLPLVLDDPFVELGEKATASMLGLLERVGSVIQIVYLTEDPAVIEWAQRRSPSGAVVRRFAGI